MSRTGRRSAMIRLAAAVGLLAQLAACAPGPAAPPDTPRLVLAEWQTWGGLCPEGPCRSTLTVRDDGSWSWTDETTDTQGLVSPREVDRLREAIVDSAFSPGTASAVGQDQAASSAVRCDAHADGRSVRYGWAAPGEGWQIVDSCEQAVDPDDPLVAHLEDLANRLAP